MKHAREIAGWLLLVGQMLVTILVVPDWSARHLAEPPYVAAVAAIATTLLILALRARRVRGSSIERATLAMFLAGMPLVYVGSWLVAPSPGWLAPELAGVAIFGALALAGALRSPWFLAGGIAAHGVFWDLSHLHRVTFVPDRYAVGCFAVDVALGAYVALEVPHFRARREARRATAA